MRFEWDEDKNRSNIAKHKVSFSTTMSVFDHQHALSVLDRFVAGGERRTLGAIGGVVLIVAARKAIPQRKASI